MRIKVFKKLEKDLRFAEKIAIKKNGKSAIKIFSVKKRIDGHSGFQKSNE